MKCDDIFDRYPGFNTELRMWFYGIRGKFFDAHISCAGRGQVEQEVVFARGASRAHWGHSSHNVNAAIDLFQLAGDVSYSLDPSWFSQIMTNLPICFEWYGAPDAPFHELPHIQLRDWKNLTALGELVFVE